MPFGPWPGRPGGGGAWPGNAGGGQPLGAATAGTLVGPSAAANHGHTTMQVANVAALALVPAAAMNAGVPVFVDTLQAIFTLRLSAAAVAPLVRVAAAGKAGYLWIRESLSPSWWNQIAWFINPATGSDEAAGTVGAPLATFAEYRRRHYARWLPGIETGSVAVTITGGNLGANDYVSVYWTNGLRGGDQVLTVNGSQTVVASGTIVAGGFNAQNRAAGQRNTINAGFAWAAHVGRQVRLTATPTTQATVMEDLGGNVAALGEQSVNGVLGAGFAVGQAIEVFTNTTVPGVHAAGPGAPNTIFLSGIDVVAAAASQVRNTGGGLSIVNAFNCRFIASASSISISCELFRPTACAFVGPNPITIQGVWFGDLTTSVALPSGINLTSPVSRNHIKSHCAQGPAFIVSENGYATISGDGSGTVGVFGLGAATPGFTINIAAHFACSTMWGSGNNATSIPILRRCGGSWSKVAEGGTSFTGLVAQGVGFRLQTGTTDIDVPLAQLPSAISDGQQPASADTFTARLTTSAGGAVLSYAGKSDVPTANQPLALRMPSSEKLALRLRGSVRGGAAGVAITGTLYIDGVATLMAVSIPAGSAVATKVVDSAHPLLIAAGHDYDVRADAVLDAAPGTIDASFGLEFAA